MLRSNLLTVSMCECLYVGTCTHVWQNKLEFLYEGDKESYCTHEFNVLLKLMTSGCFPYQWHSAILLCLLTCGKGTLFLFWTCCKWLVILYSPNNVNWLEQLGVAYTGLVLTVINLWVLLRGSTGQGRIWGCYSISIIVHYVQWLAMNWMVRVCFLVEED
jgi:hypothetical protein